MCRVTGGSRKDSITPRGMVEGRARAASTNGKSAWTGRKKPPTYLGFLFFLGGGVDFKLGNPSRKQLGSLGGIHLFDLVCFLAGGGGIGSRCRAGIGVMVVMMVMVVMVSVQHAVGSIVRARVGRRGSSSRARGAVGRRCCGQRCWRHRTRRGHGAARDSAGAGVGRPSQVIDGEVW